MKQTLFSLIEIIFPLREDAAVVRDVDEAVFAALYRTNTTDGIVSLLPYKHKAVRACIHEVKFHDSEKAARLLGTIFEQYVMSLTREVVIIPIPLSPERKSERGYNQVEQILKTTDLKSKTESGILRKAHTEPQSSLSRRERLTSVKDAFSMYDTDYARQKISDKHVLLLDDVTTTGATLKAARAALAPLRPASISCVALAH